MKWINVNERLPDKNGYYITDSDWVEEGSTMVLPNDRSDSYFRDGKWENMSNWVVREWLDESSQPSTGMREALEKIIALKDSWLDPDDCFGEAVSIARKALSPSPLNDEKK